MFGFKFNKKLKINNTAFMGVHWSQGGVSESAVFFLRSCIQWLEDPARVVEEGVYRKSAEITMLQRFRDHVDRNVQALLPILGQTRDVNAVAGLIKLYFREMPEPLIPFNLYTAVIAAAGSPGDSKNTIFKSILDLLEPDSRLMLKILCFHLYRVAQYSDQNKMTLDNLSIVFAPNLIRPEQETIATMLGDAQYARLFVCGIISDPVFFFGEEGEEEAEPAQTGVAPPRPGVGRVAQPPVPVPHRHIPQPPAKTVIKTQQEMVARGPGGPGPQLPVSRPGQGPVPAFGGRGGITRLPDDREAVMGGPRPDLTALMVGQGQMGRGQGGPVQRPPSRPIGPDGGQMRGRGQRPSGGRGGLQQRLSQGQRPSGGRGRPPGPGPAGRGGQPQRPPQRPQLKRSETGDASVIGGLKRSFTENVDSPMFSKAPSRPMFPAATSAQSDNPAGFRPNTPAPLGATAPPIPRKLSQRGVMVSSLEEDESGRRPPMVPERQLRQKNLSPTPQAPLPEQNPLESKKASYKDILKQITRESRKSTQFSADRTKTLEGQIEMLTLHLKEIELTADPQTVEMVQKQLIGYQNELELAKAQHLSLTSTLDHITQQLDTLDDSNTTENLARKKMSTQPSEDVDSDTSGLSKDAQMMREFGIAFQELREGLFISCGEDLLKEGIKLGSIERGFWLVSFSGIEAVLETWKTGARLPIQYLTGGMDEALKFSGNDEEFASTVSSYNVMNTACVILVAKLNSRAVAHYWATVSCFRVGSSNGSSNVFGENILLIIERCLYVTVHYLLETD